ncbi:T9SS type A sorting domain-containing protein [Hymenobacter negativus]|uniref:T9SS type A sorting domain-containing protein n=1 Tax=Hymenobacter negativus TaxID=2795026 RepID=A0ABS3QLL3_9BACT|nr:T9SS type A sorting domain-containing protein [Hymenobacter negativus]MBO2011873.1 T9SS type A sorting domain-containing protein [Hymenobacter negativus]
MKKIFLLFLLTVSGFTATAQVSYYTFNGGGTSGNWNDPTAWTTDPTGSTSVNGRVPSNGDIAVVTNSFVLNLTADVSTTSLSVVIQRGGSLDLGATAGFTSNLTRLGGQGTLRIGRAYFPVVNNNDFDDANTGTVEFYNWASPTGTLPQPASGQYNNLRLLNTSNTAFAAQFNANSLNVMGNLTLARSTGSAAVALTMGQASTTNRTLNVLGDITVGTGTTLGVTAVDGAHTLTVSGSLVNNGTVTLRNGTDAQRCLLRFIGATDATLACNGPTDLSQLQVSKGTGNTATLSVTSTQVAGGNLRLNYAAASDLLIINSGTAKLGANIDLPRLSNASANYDLGSPTNSPGLWIAGATVRNNTTGALVVYGSFRISAGRFESLGHEGTVIREDGQISIEGGTTVVEKFRPSNTSSSHRGSFAISGGVFECSGTGSDSDFARFSHPYKTQSFRMTGGTIRVQNPQNSSGLFHIGVNSDNATVTGGTIELLLPNTTTNCKILSTAPLWNLSVSKPTAGGTSKALLDAVGVTPAYTSGATTTAQPLTVLNNFTLSGTNPATVDANSQDVNIQGTLTIGAGCTYLPTTNTTRFSGGQDQLLTNNGSIGSTLNTFYNLTVDKSAGTLSLDGTATTFTITNTLSLLNGVLNDGSKTVSVLGNVVNSASHTSGGGTGAIVLAGPGGQVISGNGNGVFGNLIINSTAAAGAVAATLTANQSVASVLTLQSNHVLSIGINRLSLTSINPAAVVAGTGGFSSQRMIRTAGNQSDLGLRKTYGGADSFTFPVGTGSKYTPATIALSVALPLYGKVSVSPTNTRNPFVTSTNSLAYYWKVRSIDFGPIPAGSISASFTMVNTDAAGTLTSYVPGRYLPVSWTSSNNVNQVVEGSTSSTIQFPGLSQTDGEFTAGESAAFGPVTAYYSTRNGNWEDANPATTPWSTAGFTGAAASSIPGPGNPVFIGSATAGLFHTVTVTANDARSGSLVIDRGATLDVQTLTGHNFGALPDATASGAGRLRISSATATAQFPGGDFGAFLQPNGGTVEYYTTGTQNFTLPVTSFTSLPITSYKSLWLNAVTSQQVSLPNQDLRVYAQVKTGTAASYGGEVLLSGGTAGNLVIDSLLAVQAGALRYANGAAGNRTLTVGGNVTVDTGASFDVNGSGAATTIPNALLVGGSLINNGTLDFGTAGAKRTALTFTGGQDASLTGTAAGATTQLFALSVNKGNSQAPTLTVDVAGTLTTPTSGWLTLANGTLRYARPGSTLTVHDAASAYVINEKAGLTVDAAGATVTVATANDPAADLQLGGQLRVLQGTLSVGTAATSAGNDLEYASAGAPTVRVSGSGTLYVNGQVRRPTSNTNGSLRYDQSGGTVEVGGFGASATGNKERGVFEVQGTGSIFRLTGGTLALRRSNQNAVLIADFFLRPDSTVVTAGTVVLGNLAAGAGNVNVTVDSSVPLYDLRVEAGANGTNTNTGQLVGTNALTLQGSLTIGNNNSFFNANNLSLNIGQNLVNNNALTSTDLISGGFRPGLATQTTTFTGGIAAQQLAALTLVAPNLTVFGNLVLNNAQANGTLTLQSGRNARVAGTLTLSKGTLADNGQTITALGDVLNSATHTSSTGGSLTLAGTSNQNVGGSGTGRFGNVVLNNAAGATTITNQEITDVLTLTNGALTIGSNLLSLSNPGAGAVTGTFNATRCIRTNGIVADLGVRKSYPGSASDFTFPMGVAGKYTPVRLNVTANAAAGTLTVRPINTAHPSTTNPLPRELSYYWKLSSTGFSAPVVTQVFSYVDASAGNDVNGTEASYVLGRFLNGVWTPINGIAGTVSPAANTLTLASVGYFDGDYTGGESSEFGTVPTYYSRTATAGLAGGATWNDAAAWTFNADGSDSAILPGTFPTLANPVVILASHLISANGPGRGAANLSLQGTLDLGANGANNFNTVTGPGTLRIGSSLFPAGNYSEFMAGGTGGTVNYTAAVQLPARDTYNNLQFTGGNTKQLSNLDLTINGALTVAAGTTVLNPTSQSLTLTSATGGATLGGNLNLSEGSLNTQAFVLNSGQLTIGSGAVSTGTSFTNTSTGTVSNGSGAVSVGTTFSNAGTYNANVGPGPLTVGSAFTNSGTFLAGDGNLTVTDGFINAAGGNFQAAVGDVTVGGNFTNQATFAVNNANTLRIGGDFANINGGNFAAGASTVQLDGSFSNAGGTFTGGTSTVRFLANANRFVTGNPTFYNLQKSGGGTLSLSGTTDVTVSGLFTLSNGLIATGTSNTLRLTNTATQPIVGTGTSAYVSGRLAISLPDAAAASREFPVGLGGRFRPVTIQPQGASASPVVLVEIFNGAPGGTTDNSLSNLSANRYYRIQLLSGIITQPTVQLSFNTEGIVDEQVNVPGNLRVARSTGNAGPWSNAGGAGVYSPAAPRGYTISAPTVINSTSFFALASTNAVDNPLSGLPPLPVELTKFSATAVGTAVQVAWTTASEKNSAYFEVQRSANGLRFEALTQVAAQGTSTRLHNYESRDAQPLPGQSYYRLRMVDRDGTYSYSPVATVRFGKASGPASITLYPNPSTGSSFHIASQNVPTGPAAVRLFDLQGRLVSQYSVDFTQPDVAIKPNQALAAGMYVVTVQTTVGTVTQRLEVTK